jgi:hypothetical protein
MGTKEESYWDKRYKSGGTSGADPRGENRNWKWSIITEFLPANSHIIDIGCGDLSFWEGRECEDYTGIDISSTVVEQNRTKRPGWQFIVSPAERRIEGLHRECVFCFGMLFHIMECTTYVSILENLCYYSTNYIFVYNWIRNPWASYGKRRLVADFCRHISRLHLGSVAFTLQALISTPHTDGKYQYFRPLEGYMHVFEANEFHLIDTRECFDGVGAMYIFQNSSSRPHYL